MTPTTFDITIRDPSNTLPPHTTRVADVLPGNLSNHRTDFDVGTDEDLATIQVAYTAAHATGQAVTIGTITVAPVASLFTEEFTAWCDRHAGLESHYNTSRRHPELEHDLKATMPTAVYEDLDYNGTRRRIKVDAVANVTSYDGEERKLITVTRFFTVERQLKNGEWAFHRTWTHMTSRWINEIVAVYLNSGKGWSDLSWYDLNLAALDEMTGYFDYISAHGPSATDRGPAYAVKSSFLDGFAAALNNALVEWQVTD